ncbi:glycosyl transferase, group 1 [Trichodesmium erythraeum IMS101]|uniref:Glycosyl transferase, group 1 n=1 Tax=Trichodesmium erythraeum (strain IMS101) TaxID=203124 RepID=Q114S6_TRIEI|nr:glycosyltransferase family 4 protein [Trichodesmium erythraeum GBRTRLIN201]MDT9339609.1 glycosyltransferase family 4 protein [Trichodesmium erythraeum 21-75]
MKILLVCTEKLPVPCIRGGAIQTYIDGILPFLKRDHEVTVFSVADPELPDQEIRDNILYKRSSRKTSEEYYHAVTNFVAGREFDWIVIYNRPKYLPMVAEVAPNSRFILSMHNEMFHAKKIEPEEAILCLERVEKVVTVSKFIADGIAKLFPGYEHKLTPVYAGVDLKLFQPRWIEGLEGKRKEKLAALGLEDKQVILYVGRLTDKKGPHLLISAMTKVIKKHPSAVLLLVGSKWYGNNEENDYVREIKVKAEQLGGAVQMTGFIPPYEVADYFLLGDVFVCASQWEEPLARVHYEAMATGLCTITTGRGGNPEVIIPGKNGIVITDYENSGAFADCIDYLLSMPNKREEMGKRGRELAELYYSWSRVAWDILSIINDSTSMYSSSSLERFGQTG